MNVKRGIVAIACSAALGGLAWAQAPGGPPKPGPEHQKLGYFVGKWTTSGEMKPTGIPDMPSGKFTSKDTCEWFEGGFNVICRSEGSMPTGPSKGLGIMGYNAEEKVYTYYAASNDPMNMATVPHGTVQGDTWTYTDESKMGGKLIKSRYVIQVKTPTSYTFKWELQGSDGAWMTVMEGSSTKAS